MCKSKIMGVNVEDGKIKNSASKLECLVLKTPFTYLGRFTLLKSVLGSMPIFHMLIFKVPSVIKVIHGDDGKLEKDVIVGGQTCWTSIVKEARSLKGTGINVVDLIGLKLGNEDSSLFWEDKWYAGGVIKEFPRLYALELHKHAIVRMKLMAPSLDNSFRRRMRSGAEESQFNSLLEIVQVINLVPCEDRYFWSLKSEGDYSVASIRKLIDEKHFQKVGISTRWVKSVPSKVNITPWKIKTNALPTRFNLSRHGMDIDTLMCSVCKGMVCVAGVYSDSQQAEKYDGRSLLWFVVVYMEFQK
nr:RNA-directed DNA polymerase, eukaryota, reverse transcriptase zinc-binding domain protein [Tanacetum cinerariifolium]